MDTQSTKGVNGAATGIGAAEQVSTGVGATGTAGATAASNSPQAAQYIMVDAMRLSKGLKTTFWGLALVFDSIGVPIDIGMPKGMKADTVVAADDVAEAKVTDDGEASDNTDVADQVVNAAADEPEPKAAKGKKGSKAAKAVKSSAGTVDEATEPQTAEPQSSATAISIDDITKIIVQKIKKDRKNNEKIGAILKTYGIAKVSDLPADKYESFLTDLSAI